MAELIWLSYPLGLEDPRPPAIPAPKLTSLYTIAQDGASVQTLNIASHTGTHVDASLHVDEHGVAITDFAPDELVFTNPVVIDLRLEDAEVVLPAHLHPFKMSLHNAGIALFRFGVGSIRRDDPQRFSKKSPGFGMESASWLRDNYPNLKAVGMDVPSLACIDKLDETMAAHNELLYGDSNRFLVIEDMDLNKDLTGLREVRLNPWLVLGMDSAPCSVIGVID